CRDGGHYAEWAVVPTRVAQRVEVRAQEQDVTTGAVIAAAQAADVVARNRHASLVHPATYELVDVAHRFRGEGPGDGAGLLREGRENIASLHHGVRECHSIAEN